MFESFKLSSIKNLINQAANDIPYGCDFFQSQGIDATNNCIVWFVKVDSLVFMTRSIKDPNYGYGDFYNNIIVGTEKGGKGYFENNPRTYDIIYNMDEGTSELNKLFLKKVDPQIKKLKQSLKDYKEYKNNILKNKLIN